MKRGRLAHVGTIEELQKRAGESSHMEMVVAGVEADNLAQKFSSFKGASVTSHPGGARIELADV